MAARFSKTASNGSIRTRKTRPSENAFSSTPRPISTCSRNIPRPRPGWRLAKTSCSRSTTPFMKSPNNTMKKTVTFLTLAMAIGWSQIVNAKTKTSEAKPRIEVCFVLDTTGSMGGLIEGAKQKIWSIANEMISAKPTPELKLGLIGYRDRGDEYVVKSFQLTDDIDSIYGHLRDFKAEGGGDEPESVNEALAETIEKMPWSQDRKVLKIIFLVGDAPPHLDYADGPKYPELCRIAAKKDLIINTVQCGNIAETTPIWKEIAKLSEGSYAAIAQSGGVAVIATPMDDGLARLNKKIGATLIPYGNAALQREVAAKQAFAESAPASAAADRLSYNAKTGKAVQGRGELLDALANNEVKLDAIDKKDLPKEFQELTKQEMEARIAKTRAERDSLQKEVQDLAKKRDAYIQAENKRLAEAGKGDGFDEKVAETIHQQAERKGINYTP
ncbi:MAG: VWA domain-containing protein [Verrucomicrobia bacterium]|nr:MAG: VWA domain-containing protein [Verrucomicrobiota bacterium]